MCAQLNSTQYLRLYDWTEIFHVYHSKNCGSCRRDENEFVRAMVSDLDSVSTKIIYLYTPTNMKLGYFKNVLQYRGLG